MTIQEMIDVLKAYQEGKEIEFKYITSDDSDWIVTTKPSFNFNTCEYRVKPEITVRKFKLIKNYPLSPPLGTVLEFSTEKDFNDGVETSCPNVYYLTDCVGFPEYWEEVIEEKIYTHKDDLFKRSCINESIKFECKIINQTKDFLYLLFKNNVYSITYEEFNKNYKLC